MKIGNLRRHYQSRTPVASVYSTKQEVVDGKYCKGEVLCTQLNGKIGYIGLTENALYNDQFGKIQLNNKILYPMISKKINASDIDHVIFNFVGTQNFGGNLCDTRFYSGSDTRIEYRRTTTKQFELNCMMSIVMKDGVEYVCNSNNLSSANGLQISDNTFHDNHLYVIGTASMQSLGSSRVHITVPEYSYITTIKNSEYGLSTDGFVYATSYSSNFKKCILSGQTGSFYISRFGMRSYGDNYATSCKAIFSISSVQFSNTKVPFKIKCYESNSYWWDCKNSTLKFNGNIVR